jgi:hypothetical protein
MRMNKFSDRRVLSTVASLGLLAGMILPALTPAFASAAEITTRSIDLSTSAAAATSVTYSVTFTPVSSGGGYVIDFCSNTSIPTETCTAPGGLNTSGVGTTTSGYAAATLTSDSGVTVTKSSGSFTGGTPLTVVLTGITNPTAVGTFYARIVTYDTSAHAGAPTGNSTLTTGNTDSGGVALSTTNSFSVNAAVLESMTFCVSGIDLSTSDSNANCAGATTPSLTLGETSGGVTALSASALSTGTVYTQISTNAEHGAIVSMKSNATGCGGMLLASDPSACYIAPATTGGFSLGTAKFGVKTGTAVATSGSGGGGTLEPVSASGYNSSTYLMNYNGTTTGVDSAYGDPILDTGTTGNDSVNNMNMPLTFGASISNNTPAGEYAASINMIASGTF